MLVHLLKHIFSWKSRGRLGSYFSFRGFAPQGGLGDLTANGLGFFIFLGGRLASRIWGWGSTIPGWASRMGGWASRFCQEQRGVLSREAGWLGGVRAPGARLACLGGCSRNHALADKTNGNTPSKPAPKPGPEARPSDRPSETLG